MQQKTWPAAWIGGFGAGSPHNLQSIENLDPLDSAVTIIQAAY
jgi:hypothetical protein